MTTFRRGDRVRCVVSTADVLAGWELLGTLGTVVNVATVEPGIHDEGWDEVWGRWDRPAPSWPRGSSIRFAAEDVERMEER